MMPCHGLDSGLWMIFELGWMIGLKFIMKPHEHADDMLFHPRRFWDRWRPPEVRFWATMDWRTFFWVRYGWKFQCVGEDPKNSKGLGRTASRVFHVLVMSRVVWQPGCQTSLGIQKSKIGEFHLPPRYITAQACSPTKSVHRLVVTLSHEHGTHKPSSECALQHFIFRWIL